MWTGTAEYVDREKDNAADVDLVVTNELGCGCHTKMGSKHYGAEWEQHLKHFTGDFQNLIFYLSSNSLFIHTHHSSSTQ